MSETDVKAPAIKGGNMKKKIELTADHKSFSIEKIIHKNLIDRMVTCKSKMSSF